MGRPEGFSQEQVTRYRKLADNRDKLDEYYESTDDVPTGWQRRIDRPPFT